MKLTGWQAIEFAAAHEMGLSKYTDPTEDAREGLTVDEARKIAFEDPSLVYVDLPDHDFKVGDRVEAGEGEDFDQGRIVSISGGMATVAWDSGVRTPASLEDLVRG